jgi:hypothetical protein
MDQLTTGEPVWDLQFDENGNLTSPAQGDFVAQVAGQGVQDLFMFSHGWDTSPGDAQALYATMFPLIETAALGAPGLGKLGFAGIYWPSMWFPPTPATLPVQGGSTQAVTGTPATLSAGTAAVSGAEIAASLAPGFADAAQQDTITRIGQLIDNGQAMAQAGQTDEVKRGQLTQISQLITSLTPQGPPSGPYEDSGETALLMTENPADDYQKAAAVFGDTAASDSTEGIGDWFTSAINGAKDALRVLSYWTMKTRAGTVGQSGLGPLLRALHAQSPGTRVHLIGHSFGARLVSFALAGIDVPADSPVASLVLLQGAFSHWSFAGAADNPFGTPGTLNTVGDRVHGPLAATFTAFDWAVGVWYPKASFLAGQNLSAVAADPWGGMGADAFQPPGSAATVTMPAGGGLTYGFTPGTFYRVDANSVINNTAGEPFSGAHSDIRKMPVAQLVVAAAAAHA